LVNAARGDPSGHPLPAWGLGQDDHMRALVQRVRRASVTVDSAEVGAIGAGLLVFVGVTHDDGQVQAGALAAKVHTLRILDGERSAADVGAPLLVVSQFTLYADTRKGRRPSWNAAAPGPVAEPLISHFVDALRARGAEVATGVFGADMAVELVNDGPVTLMLEV
jgi:D-tyrosyl-tRNA(Tyr) deacylase